MKKILLFFPALVISMYAIAQPGIQWEQSYGGSSDDAAYAVIQTADGGYIAAGTALSSDGQVTGFHGGADMWVTKISATGTLQWEKALGGSGADGASCILQTADGGYVVAGSSSSTDGDVTGNHGSSDFWVVRLDTAGNIQWQKSLGGSDEDKCSAMVQAAEGGFILTGFSMSNDGDVTGHKGLDEPDVWVVKINDTGGIEWENSYGGSSYDYASGIKQTPDGGYILACTTASVDGDINDSTLTGTWGLAATYGYWIIKLSETGVLQWHKLFRGDNDCEASSIALTMDGGYIANGMTRATDEPGSIVTGKHGMDDNSDYWVVKLNDTGALQWEKCLGTPNDDFGTSIMQVADSGYIVFGYISGLFTGITEGDVTDPFGGDDYWLAKLTPAGALSWAKSFGGTNDDVGYAISATADGNYILAGGSQSTDGEVTGNHGTQDFWIVKLKCSEDAPVVTRTGHTLSTASFATYQWTLNGVPIPGATSATYGALTNGSYAVIVTTAGGCSDTSAANVITGLSVSSAYSAAAIAIFPNPTTGNISVTGVTNVTIRVHNLPGELIKEEPNTGNISIAEFPPGMYFIDLLNEQGELLKHEKIVKD